MLYIQDVLGDKETEINEENKLEIQLEDLEMQNGGDIKEFTIEASEPNQKL